jgi:F0F1-type ATP synthase membrane subunit b/b'
MGSFAGQMKDLTEHLKSSTATRQDALAGVHLATAGLLKEARGFLDRVTEQHHEMAGDLQVTLASHRDTRRESAEALRQKHRESLEQMREHLRSTLGAHQRELKDGVQVLMSEFATSRHELADDLKEASQTWHQHTRAHAGRDASNGSGKSRRTATGSRRHQG